MLKRLFIVTIPVALVLAWYLRARTNVTAFEDSSSVLTTKPAARLQSQILSPRKLPKNESIDSFSEICRESFTQLFENNLERSIQSRGKEGNLSTALETSLKCESPKQAPKALSEHLRRLKESCRDKSDVTTPCLLQTLVYRSLANSYLQRNIPIRDITDVKLLTDRLVASLAEKSPYETIETLDRLEQLVPDVKETSRARATAYLSIAIDEALKEGKVSPATRQELARSVQLAKENSSSKGQDDDLIEVDLYSSYVIDRHAGRLMERALEMREKYPQSGVPEQFLAIASFKKGNKAESIEHLRRYQALTGDPRTSDTIARIQRGDKSPFEIELRQSIELLQLDLEPASAE